MAFDAPLHDVNRRGFASDNYSGVHPEVLTALALANGGHVTSYGADPYTARLQEVMKGHFGPDTQTYPVFNGTGANVTSLALLTDRWDGVICAQTAHVNVDECGAPEKLAGVKLYPIPTSDGKLTPALVDREAHGFDFEHRARPKVVTITQTTELGTCYTPQEIEALAAHVHGLGMLLHVDGTRLANAAVTLGATLGEVTPSVDVISLGGTKNGLLAAEAIVVRNPAVVSRPLHLRKMMAQLSSKMRFTSAQLLALYDGDLYLRSAAHSNAMAQRLAAGVAGIDGIRITQPVQANGVFAILPKTAADQVRGQYFFYDWDQSTGEVRWMCGWDTTEADVDGFVAALTEAMR